MPSPHKFIAFLAEKKRETLQFQREKLILYRIHIRLQCRKLILKNCMHSFFELINRDIYSS